MAITESKLSVLMSVYKNELPVNLNKALQSIFSQSLMPKHLVLVKDGPLSRELEQVINHWKSSNNSTIITISLDKNYGLAIALNKGLEHISSEFIARMDSDDIALPDRFEKQVRFLLKNPETDVVGSWIAEIDENDKIIKSEVRYPQTHDACLRAFAFRDPVAHPAVMFRKRYFDKAGVYSKIHVGENKNEDTNLWFRGFKKGCVFANLPEILLHFRRSQNFYTRRSGLMRGKLIFKDRLRINMELRYGIKANLFAFAYFLLGLTPSWLKKFLYQYFR